MTNVFLSKRGSVRGDSAGVRGGTLARENVFLSKRGRPGGMRPGAPPLGSLEHCSSVLRSPHAKLWATKSLRASCRRRDGAGAAGAAPPATGCVVRGGRCPRLSAGGVCHDDGTAEACAQRTSSS
eukprot:COSAG06_NODE_21494_length_755_cov_0.900915_2_plen_124_part_01